MTEDPLGVNAELTRLMEDKLTDEEKQLPPSYWLILLEPRLEDLDDRPLDPRAEAALRELAKLIPPPGD